MLAPCPPIMGELILRSYQTRTLPSRAARLVESDCSCSSTLEGTISQPLKRPASPRQAPPGLQARRSGAVTTRFFAVWESAQADLQWMSRGLQRQAGISSPSPTTFTSTLGGGISGGRTYTSARRWPNRRRTTAPARYSRPGSGPGRTAARRDTSACRRSGARAPSASRR